jgi:hypothetical protein
MVENAIRMKDTLQRSIVMICHAMCRVLLKELFTNEKCRNVASLKKVY